MSVALKKLDGVETVDVSLEKASADIRLRADNHLTMARIRQVIRANGYPTTDADIDARGKIVERAGKPVLDLLNGTTMPLAEGSRRSTDTIVELSGTSRSPGKGQDDQVTIKSLK